MHIFVWFLSISEMSFRFRWTHTQAHAHTERKLKTEKKKHNTVYNDWTGRAQTTDIYCSWLKELFHFKVRVSPVWSTAVWQRTDSILVVVSCFSLDIKQQHTENMYCGTWLSLEHSRLACVMTTTFQSLPPGQALPLLPPSMLLHHWLQL